jgi:RNA polymerase sigma-70 factor, ECF subfamily
MDDNEIIKRCKRGEKEAFQELISRYHPFVYKYLFRISDNNLIVDDLVQEAFIKMIKGIDKFDLYGNAKFSTYLITIAKNCYIDYYRKEKKRTSEVSIDELSNIEASGTSIQELIANKLYNESVLALLENLTEDQRIAIKLKYIEDLTLKEIGEILNIEPKTIKSRIHNGIVKLRSMIEGRNYDERD